MATEKVPEYPFFTESERQFRRWYFSRFDNLPSEQEVRQWRTYTFPHILTLPPLGCETLVETYDRRIQVQDLGKIPTTRFADSKPVPTPN
ncbi:hypothetical protein A3B45_03775 [Candidatus Daviesbacteria bacterium RIFCSPLOWO2_01_FULL_39_12]|uniref:Uncharacterized protein n=1 Tax=Candidatus Daviesbacteria bacterium RIFCSPLOWO2_01_FULL_39_12 TaxID=1797785 RepID=A0A1F5KTW0_9BACT|nr:MAG: hypothetical protein A3D79_03035 [Candidatus Daviesbacteria bacterium RIFCSPHIGHO2_02_FULL_39_8]OGE44368.1 MAG: hypothetical protein A3B45_03775 [Candidatus Daviesbacteria bacterium RIFCSPLOWO2_01_FULL_39_12]